MSSQAERRRHVADMLTNFRLEGLAPTEADKQLHEAYIAGTATLDDMLVHADDFARAAAYAEWFCSQPAEASDGPRRGASQAQVMAEMRARLESDRIAEDIMEHDDGAAAKAHLAAGRPIYYCEDAYPDEIVRKWFDGRRELVKVTEAGNIWSIRPYPEDIDPIATA
jgi:hypothetical protein